MTEPCQDGRAGARPVPRGRLTPTQRRIAHCLVEHAAPAAYLSAAEVAELAGVSQPSVTRFAMALGYDGYPALRRELRESRPAPAARPAPPTTATPCSAAVRAETEHLQRLADQLADLRRRRARPAGCWPPAGRCRCSGCGRPAPLAAYFGYFAAKVHPDVRVLDDGGTPAAGSARTGPRGRRGRDAGVRAAPLPAGGARRGPRGPGRRAVASWRSPTRRSARPPSTPTWCCPPRSAPQLVFDLHTGPMAMAMVLLQAMCDAAPGRRSAGWRSSRRPPPAGSIFEA